MCLRTQPTERWSSPEQWIQLTGWRSVGFGDVSPHAGTIRTSCGRGYPIPPCKAVRFLVMEIHWAEICPAGPQHSLLGRPGHRRHLLPWGCVKLYHWKYRGRETAVKISYLKILKLQSLPWKPFYGIFSFFIIIFYLFLIAAPTFHDFLVFGKFQSIKRKH